MTTQPINAGAVAMAERAAMSFMLGTTKHEVVSGALRGIAHSTLSLRGGTEETNDVLREIVLSLAVAEIGEQPDPDTYPDDELGAVDFAEATSRWLDALEEIADEKTPLALAVLRATADVIDSRTTT